MWGMASGASARWTASTSTSMSSWMTRTMAPMSLSGIGPSATTSAGTLRYWSECDNQCWKIDYWCVNPEVNLPDLNLEEIAIDFPALNAENQAPLKEKSELVRQSWAQVVSTGNAQNKEPLVL